MADLQSRLDAVFGGLKKPQDEAEKPEWQPTKKSVFRGGALREGGDSSDEEREWQERQRKELVPGLIRELVAEGEPDAGDFQPSAAFCRAMDREEEYNEVDELATGEERELLRSGPRTDMPPRSTEVLPDNVWEQRIREREAAAEAEAAGNGGMAEPMQAEAPGQAAAAPEREPSSPGALRPTPSKRVRFQGVPEPWVPPHRREGYATRPPAGPPAASRQGPTSGGSRVPDHVRHPDRYTCYTFDEPVTVGGGVGQLAQERDAEQSQAVHEALALAQWPAEEGAAEPDAGRWRGEVGGGIQFRPRRPGQDAAGGGGTQEAPRAKPAPQAAAPMAISEEEEAEEGEQAEQEAPAGAAAGAPGGRRRQYRSSRMADDEDGA